MIGTRTLQRRVRRVVFFGAPFQPGQFVATAAIAHEQFITDIRRNNTARAIELISEPSLNLTETILLTGDEICSRNVLDDGAEKTDIIHFPNDRSAGSGLKWPASNRLIG